MIRSFKLTIRCKNDQKNTPLALQLKKIIIKEMPYLTAVNLKEYGKQKTKA